MDAEDKRVTDLVQSFPCLDELQKKRAPDFLVQWTGSYCLVHPQNDAARERLKFVGTGGERTWEGDALAVEARYVNDFVDALKNGGDWVVEKMQPPRPVSTIERFNALIRSFPCLACKNPPKVTYGGPGIMPFVKWAKGNCASHGEMLAAKFVAHVWSGGRKVGLGKLDMFEALQTWDPGNRAAFAAFCREPFWP